MMGVPTVTLYLSGSYQAGLGGFLTVRYGKSFFVMKLPPRIVELIVLMSEARDSCAHLLDETNCGFLSRHCILTKLGWDVETQTLSRYVSDFKRAFLAESKRAGFPDDFLALITTERGLGMRLTWRIEIHNHADLVRAGGPPRSDTGTARDSDGDDDCIQTAP